MRKYILSVAVLLFAMFLGMECSAAPFLTCDPYAATTGVDFRVRFNGGAWVDVPATVAADGGRSLKYDLAPLALANGNHTVEIKAVNLWAESPTTPFSFSKDVPVAPVTIHLSKQ